MTTTAEKSGQFLLGDRTVHRIGYGAMKLSGPHVMGPPADRDAAIALLRRAVEDNLDHLGLDAMEVVNLRMPGFDNPVQRSVAEPMEVLAELQQEGLIRHI